MRRYWLLSVLSAAAVLAVLGCGPQPTRTEPPSTEPPRRATPTSESIGVPTGAEGVITSARKDLSVRLKVQEQDIGLVRVEATDWPDSSLGCPKPGMMYAQVITPGYRVILTAGGATYEYHTDRQGRAVSCP